MRGKQTGEQRRGRATTVGGGEGARPPAREGGKVGGIITIIIN